MLCAARRLAFVLAVLSTSLACDAAPPASAPAAPTSPTLPSPLPVEETLDASEATPVDASAPKRSMPVIRLGASSVTGQLAPEIVHRVVRRGFVQLGACYERALRTAPDLHGQVSVAFIVDEAGAVTSMKDAGSDLADRAAVACVLRELTRLAYPKPASGSVKIDCRVLFWPDAAAAAKP